MRPVTDRLAHPGWCINLVEAAGLEPGERVLVVVDEPLLEEGAQLAATVQDAGGQPRLELWAGTRPLSHPPAAVLDAADRSSLAYFLAEQPLAEEADARFELMERVSAHRGREIFMGFVDGALLGGELSEPQPDLSERATRLLEQLRGSERVRVRGAAGTDLELNVAGRRWLSDIGVLAAGAMANFPGGEVYVAPHRDGADGVLVADVTVPYTVEGLVDAPVTLCFEEGRVRSIEGGRAADLLRELVADAGPGADVIAELGLGLNSSIVPRGHIMLDEKAGNTAHVAIGRNTGSYGGDNEATIHVDCVFSEPELEVDGRRVEID